MENNISPASPADHTFTEVVTRRYKRPKKQLPQVGAHHAALLSLCDVCEMWRHTHPRRIVLNTRRTAQVRQLRRPTRCILAQVPQKAGNTATEKDGAPKCWNDPITIKLRLPGLSYASAAQGSKSQNKITPENSHNTHSRRRTSSVVRSTVHNEDSHHEHHEPTAHETRYSCWMNS